MKCDLSGCWWLRVAGNRQLKRAGEIPLEFMDSACEFLPGSGRFEMGPAIPAPQTSLPIVCGVFSRYCFPAAGDDVLRVLLRCRRFRLFPPAILDVSDVSDLIHLPSHVTARVTPAAATDTRHYARLDDVARHFGCLTADVVQLGRANDGAKVTDTETIARSMMRRPRRDG